MTFPTSRLLRADAKQHRLGIAVEMQTLNDQIVRFRTSLSSPSWSSKVRKLRKEPLRGGGASGFWRGAVA